MTYNTWDAKTDHCNATSSDLRSEHLYHMWIWKPP